MGLLNANAVGWVYVKKDFPHAYKDSTISEAVAQKNLQTELSSNELCWKICNSGLLHVKI